MVSALSVRQLTAGGADDEAARQRDGAVVDAEVRVELGRRVELVRVPAAILEHAEFGNHSQ